MNEILAKVEHIQSVETLNLVRFTSLHHTFEMLSLELNSAIEINKEVKLYIKPSSIAIAKGINSALSYSNQLQATIVSIEFGEILTCITLDIKDAHLESIITTASAQKLSLQEEDAVIALIQSNEISIMEII